MLCQGRVKQTMAFPEGKMIIMRVAEAGELLGLHSVFSGDAFETTAETLQSCHVDFVRRKHFLKLLSEHRDIAVSVIQQFSDNYRGACHQIHLGEIVETEYTVILGFGSRGKRVQAAATRMPKYCIEGREAFEGFAYHPIPARRNR